MTVCNSPNLLLHLPGRALLRARHDRLRAARAANTAGPQDDGVGSMGADEPANGAGREGGHGAVRARTSRTPPRSRPTGAPTARPASAAGSSATPAAWTRSTSRTSTRARPARRARRSSARRACPRARRTRRRPRPATTCSWRPPKPSRGSDEARQAAEAEEQRRRGAARAGDHPAARLPRLHEVDPVQAATTRSRRRSSPPTTSRRARRCGSPASRSARSRRSSAPARAATR